MQLKKSASIVLQKFMLVTNLPAMLSGCAPWSHAKCKSAAGKKPRCSSDSTQRVNMVHFKYLEADVNLLDQGQWTLDSMDTMYKYCTAEAGSIILRRLGRLDSVTDADSVSAGVRRQRYA